MKVNATIKYINISPNKLRIIAPLIIGKSVDKGLALLTIMPQKASKILYKVLNSAIANAVNIHNQKRNNLIINQITINKGPTLKRFRPRARGSASSIRHPSSHIKIILDEVKHIINKSNKPTRPKEITKTNFIKNNKNIIVKGKR